MIPQEHLDLRQRKTRRQLTEALSQLLEERPFADISVVDLCERAMVHRTTFYSHFNDKQELLLYLLEQLEQECVETCLPQEGAANPRQYCLEAAEQALAFFYRRRSLYRACLAAGVQTKAHILEDSVAEELRDRLSKPPFDGHLYGRDPEVAARFYVGAMLSVIRWWLTESHPLPQEELLRNVARLLPEFSGE